MVDDEKMMTDGERLTLMELEQVRLHKGEFQPTTLAQFPKLASLAGDGDLLDAYTWLMHTSAECSRLSRELRVAHFACFGLGTGANKRLEAASHDLRIEPRNLVKYVQPGLKELAGLLVAASQRYQEDPITPQLTVSVVNQGLRSPTIATVVLIRESSRSVANIREPTVYRPSGAQGENAETIGLVPASTQGREILGGYRSSWTFDVDIESLPIGEQVQYSCFFNVATVPQLIVQNLYAGGRAMITFWVHRDVVHVCFYRVDLETSGEPGIAGLPSPILHTIL